MTQKAANLMKLLNKEQQPLGRRNKNPFGMPKAFPMDWGHTLHSANIAHKIYFNRDAADPVANM